MASVARESLRSFAADAEAVAWVDAEAHPPRARSVTYAELIAMADKISHVVTRAASPQAGVGLCLDNSLAAVVCQIGALWAGTFFVPLDQPSTQPRLREMLRKSAVEVIFASPHIADEVKCVAANGCCGRSIDVLVIDDAELLEPTRARFCMRSTTDSDGPPDAMMAARRAACRRVCTFHTSGTTGVPKPIHSAGVCTILDRPKNLPENIFSKEGKSFHILKNLCEIYPKLPKVVTFPSRRG